MLELHPIELREAQAFIRRHHRHHGPPRGWKFGVAVARGEWVVGVIVVGRPLSRMLQNGWTAEVLRCCIDPAWSACEREARKEGIRISNAASMLYGAAQRGARAMGYRRVITYTLREERGTSLRAAGWKALYDTEGGSWSRKARPRVDTAPTGQKTLWEAA